MISHCIFPTENGIIVVITRDFRYMEVNSVGIDR